MNNIKEQLINIAHVKGICADGYKQMLGSADVDAMINYYVANPDWCLERDFPDIQMLRDHFANISNKGVFVDRTFDREVLNDLQTYIFHNCKGTIRVGLNVDKAIIPMLYFANRCDMTVVGVPSNKWQQTPVTVPVYEFGDNDVTANNNKYVEYKRYEEGVL